jgi:2-dehydro-3-deoxyphosphooctonate aldolase (KDO 8-P synthase)
MLDQSDLIVACATSFRAITVKKGQFLMPQATKHIVDKITSVAPEKPFALIERGASFGYGDLVVDMRSFQIMASYASKVIFDITHSLQQPGANEVTKGLRSMAPSLSRAAAATGYVNGFFMEVHPNPEHALSDKETQLNIGQASKLIPQLIDLTQRAKELQKIDASFR